MGVRVVDFTHVRVGPLASRILTFFGAEVINVERTDEFDMSRWPTMGVGQRRKGRVQLPADSPDISGNFNNINADKRSITLNVRYPEGLSLIEQLIRESDAVIENYSASVLENWGLTFERMKEINPLIVYVSMSEFGHSGPLKSFRSFGPTAQAMSGQTLASGLPGKLSAGWGFSYMDVEGAFIGGLALASAIYHARRTGQACYIDDAITEGAMYLLGPLFFDYAVNGRSTRRPNFPPGNRSLFPSVAPHNTLRCSGVDRVGQDHWCFIACETQEQFKALCGVMGSEALANDPRFHSNAERLQHQDALEEIIGEWTAPRSRHNVMTVCQEAGIIAAPIQDTEDRVEWDPQLRHRDMFPVAEN